MNNMEIQPEAIIEIVGTQYNNRAINHKDLMLSQKLVMKHQLDNPHDPNAVVITTNTAKELGLLIAKKAAEKKIETVVFDRGGYIYHGIVKELAEAAREGGLKF